MVMRILLSLICAASERRGLRLRKVILRALRGTFMSALQLPNCHKAMP
jgi:hypothetical protein